jgi:type IV fimbrial biogenesis protein FimT
MDMGKHAPGFTLLEMIIAVSISAILLTIAVPSFSASRLNSQLRASANDLVASVNLARNEALKRNRPVTLCVSNADGSSCAAGNWGQGWVVMMGATPIHSVSAVAQGFRITETTSGATSLEFQSTGVDTTPASFTVCRAAPNLGNQERVVNVDATGRASVRRTTSGTCP